MLNYIQLGYHKNPSEYQLFLHFLVDDHHLFTRKAELLYRSTNPMEFIRYLTEMIRSNCHMATTLKYEIGNFNHLDMVLDLSKFLEDILRIAETIADGDLESEETEQTGSRDSGKLTYIEYIRNYRRFFGKIIDLEMKSYLDHQTRAGISTLMLNSFNEYAHQIILEEVSPDEIESSCQIQGEGHDSNLTVLILYGVPLVMCNAHGFGASEVSEHLHLIE